jgi:copper(I)-binding protein
MIRTLLFGATAAVLFVSSALGEEASHSYMVRSLVIESPWIRATPEGAKVAAGYVKITNTGDAPDRLIGGSLPVANSVEIHEMTMSGSVMKMRRLKNGLEIGPGKSVELKPGSYHLMFTGLQAGLKDKEMLKGTLLFQKARFVDVEYSVGPMGASSAMHVQH